MSSLFILIHADPKVLQSYRSAISARQLQDVWTVETFYAGAFSSAYVQAATAFRSRGGSALKGLIEQVTGQSVAGWDRIVLGSFSAGYALVRQILHESSDLVTGWVAIDSGHAAHGPDGHVMTLQVEPFADLGRRAVLGEAMLWLGHTDVKTTTFASTTEFADKLVDLVGLPRGPAGGSASGVTRSEKGLFKVVSFDLVRSEREEHAKALTVWGPGFVADALAALDRSGLVSASEPTLPDAPSAIIARGSSGSIVRAWQEKLATIGFDPGAIDGIFGPATDKATRRFQESAGLKVDGIVGRDTRAAAQRRMDQMPTIPPPTETAAGLGSAVRSEAIADLRADVREVPAGSNDGPAIRAYFDGTGVEPPQNWCAAAVTTWMKRAAQKLGVSLPVTGSLGAKALMEQFRRTGRFVTAAEIRRDHRRLSAGMIVFWDRSDPARPSTAWWGHVGVCSSVEQDPAFGHIFGSIEGNSGTRGDRVAEMSRSVDDPRFLGAGWLD